MATPRKDEASLELLAMTREWVAASLRFADATLASAPAKPHIVRAPSAGVLVVRFVLPLELCAPQNRTRHGQPWQLGKLKQEIGQMLHVQILRQGLSPVVRGLPLPGRPLVRCIRFSSVEPDKYNDGFKLAIDRLCQPGGRRRDGLGFLRDDRPTDCEIYQWWEYAPRGQGFGLIELWTGEERSAA